jgi:hypothetical protein
MPPFAATCERIPLPRANLALALRGFFEIDRPAQSFQSILKGSDLKSLSTCRSTTIRREGSRELAAAQGHQTRLKPIHELSYNFRTVLGSNMKNGKSLIG